MRTTSWAAPRASRCSAAAPEGMRAIYTTWTNVIDRLPASKLGPAGVYVNLAFNRDSPWGRVVSFFPDAGRLTVKAAVERRLLPPPAALGAARAGPRLPRVAAGAGGLVGQLRPFRRRPAWRRVDDRLPAGAIFSRGAGPVERPAAIAVEVRVAGQHGDQRRSRRRRRRRCSPASRAVLPPLPRSLFPGGISRRGWVFTQHGGAVDPVVICRP